MLGRDVMAHLAGRHDAVGVDLEVDVSEPLAVEACVDDVRPEAILHLAAVTDVDGAEEREAEAERVNGEGTRNVARAAARLGVPLVAVSTDYVFDGRAAEPVPEHATPGPLQAYGRTKLSGEIAAREEWGDGVRIARTSWLYGPHGRNFVDTMRRLGAEREEVAVVDDQRGCPTWTRDLAPALEGLITARPGVHHTAGGGSCTWADLAEAVFDLAGLPCRVRRVGTSEFARPAARPAMSALAVTRPDTPRLRPWRQALADHLALVTA
jgi:dTDP-4-dehydrorhamnose reductase